MEKINKTKSIQIKTFKKENELTSLFNSIDIKSLELYSQMMKDRYSK
jgi:hypothetical protein